MQTFDRYLIMSFFPPQKTIGTELFWAANVECLIDSMLKRRKRKTDEQRGQIPLKKTNRFRMKNGIHLNRIR